LLPQIVLSAGMVYIRWKIIAKMIAKVIIMATTAIPEPYRLRHRQESYTQRKTENIFHICVYFPIFEFIFLNQTEFSRFFRKESLNMNIFAIV